MEEFLKRLYDAEGVTIFREDYKLLLKLLDQYPKGPLRQDAYCINALLNGNALYKSIIEALRSEKHEVSLAEYNTFIAQMFSTDRFWQSESVEPAHAEYLLRMLYKVAGIDVSGIPVTILPNESGVEDKEALLNELSSAEEAYANKYYRAAFEKSETLFENGVSSAAVLLSKAYYHGQGTHKDFNKALFYLTYPHKRTRQQDKEERIMLDSLLEMRDKSMYLSVVALAGSVLAFLFMFVTGFWSKHIAFALFNTAVLVAGSILFVMSYRRKLIFDFSYWFLILGITSLIVLIL